MGQVTEVLKRCLSYGEETEWFEYKQGTAVSKPDEVGEYISAARTSPMRFLTPFSRCGPISRVAATHPQIRLNGSLTRPGNRTSWTSPDLMTYVSNVICWLTNTRPCSPW